MNILALDLGVDIAWAIRAPDGGLIYGSDDVGERYKHSSLSFWLLRIWLSKIAHDASENGVQLEIVFVAGDAAVHRKWIPHLEEFAGRTGISVRGVGVNTVKKFIAKRGNAPQEAIVGAIEALGHHVPAGALKGPARDRAAKGEAMAIAALLYAEAGLLPAEQFSFSNMTAGGSARERRRREVEDEIAEMRRRDLEF
jgi:hypothetical protein